MNACGSGPGEPAGWYSMTRAGVGRSLNRGSVRIGHSPPSMSIFTRSASAIGGRWVGAGWGGAAGGVLASGGPPGGGGRPGVWGGGEILYTGPPGGGGGGRGGGGGVGGG